MMTMVDLGAPTKAGCLIAARSRRVDDDEVNGDERWVGAAAVAAVRDDG